MICLCNLVGRLNRRVGSNVLAYEDKTSTSLRHTHLNSGKVKLNHRDSRTAVAVLKQSGRAAEAKHHDDRKLPKVQARLQSLLVGMLLGETRLLHRIHD